MATTTATITETKTVDTTVNYDILGPDELYRIGTASLYRNRPFDVKAVQVHDIRGREPEFNLAKQGFELHKHNLTFKDFNEDDRVKSVWWQEAGDFLKSKLHATKVVPFSHIIRKQSYEAAEAAAMGGPDDKPLSTLHPARFVHIDQAPEGAPILGQDIFQDAWPTLSSTRWGIVNVWKPISPVIRKDPLGMVDRTTVAWEDLVPKKVGYPQARTGAAQIASDKVVHRVCFLKHNKAHNWHYVSEMRPDEVLFLRIYDSNTPEGESTGTPHSSFVHQEMEGEPLRESIETRFFVFWEDQPVR